MQPLLSIFTPTHYSDAKHYASLMNLIAIGEELKEVEVIISDNSGKIEKHNFLKNFEAKNVKIITGEMDDNYHFALKNTTGEYVLPCGDDDFVFSAGIAAILEQIKQDKASNNLKNGYTGVFCNKHSRLNDFFRIDGIGEDLISERVAGWIKCLPKGNPIFHSVMRRDSALQTWDFWFNQLPNPQAYQDQLATLYFVLLGSTSFVNQSYFMYEATNWGNVENMINSEIKYMLKSKSDNHAPLSYLILQRLELAVTGFFLIKSKRFDSPEDDKQKAATIWFLRWYELWKQQSIRFYMDIKVIKECPYFLDVLVVVDKYKNLTELSPNNILQDMADILQKFNNKGDEYLQFWHSV